MRPKIVVMAARGRESFTEAQYRRLKGLGELEILRAPAPLTRSAFVENFSDAEFAAWTPRGTPPLDGALVDQMPRLRGVALPTTGTEWIDLSPLRDRNIQVTHVPGFSSASAAEFTWALLLSLAKKLGSASAVLRSGASPSGNLRGMELWRKTLGIVGLGAIGSRVARIARAFGMQVIACEPRPVKLAGVSLVSSDILWRESDVVSLHTPLTADTRELVDENTLARMKRGALLVNTARPGLVRLTAIEASLEAGHLGGYAFDIGYLDPKSIRRFADLPGVIAVPHISWYTPEAAAREINGWIAELGRLTRGTPRNLVVP